MTLFHKIETAYERDEKTHRLVEPLVLKNRVYGIVSPWVFTEKIDGTNVRCIWGSGAVIRDVEEPHPVLAASPRVVTFGGKTDESQLSTKLLTWLMANVTAEKFAAAFPELADGESVVLYGEGYGAGIQKGGENYSPDKKLILFDVWVNGWWLSDENLRDVGRKMGLDCVPMIGEMTLAEATEMVRAGFPTRLGSSGAPAEGLVGKPCEPLFDKKGSRLVVKIKTKDFTGKK